MNDRCPMHYASLFQNIRDKKPLIHHITNYVTVNDCANVTLAIGAAPIMADAIEESPAIAAISSALVLNMGTLNIRTVESMIAAGKSANAKGIPVIFDPVGAGASTLRNEAAGRILRDVKIDVLRGNISEIGFIAGLAANTKGVDASESDMQNNAAQLARDLAKERACIVAITGAVDAVSDGVRILRIENGHPALARITGTGCMCSSLVGSFCGGSPNALLEATATAVLCMGVAGEIAYEKAGDAGNGSFHMAILDAISKLDADTLHRRAKVYEA